MTARELTELALRIERLRNEVAAACCGAPPAANAALHRAERALQAALDVLDPYIGRAIRIKARTEARCGGES